MRSRTSYPTRRLHTRRSITYSYSSTSRISLHIIMTILRSDSMMHDLLRTVRIERLSLHTRSCTVEIEGFTALRSLQSTKWQCASWNFHATARTNTNNKQDIQWTELVVFFCTNNLSHLHSGACKKQKIWPSCCQCRERVKCRSSEIYDFRYLARALADARTSIQWPLATQPPKYFDKSFHQTAFVAPAQPN